ncbi:hypothetical protein [Nocardia stercoris]|uniref:Uncharacterized protein n=1 Tax=Nocardia stercoris TaxID=2483361 RepID=A0A3M2L5T3_9NOCA|nr:hypothetical protein [Nocardia stercoris]RMI32704.1 hypothetical protein EBN03_12135 [Nocardia stercoris]
MRYPWALALTLLVEVPIYTAMLVTAKAFRPARAAATGTAVNLVSHPLLWSIISRAAPNAFWATLIVAEIGVCLLEAALVYAVRRRRPGELLLISVTANAASLLAGFLV